ncbi:MAG: HDIG domain-containing metalloprotein [Anaerolineales bacterium]
MSLPLPERPRIVLRHETIWLALILGLSAVAAFTLLVVPLSLNPQSVPLAVGQVSPQDLQAPRSLTFESALLTERARQDAERAVPLVYSPPDPAIARQQLDKLRAALQYITQVRQDEFATPAQKQADLAAMKDLTLPAASIESLLALSNPRWEAVQQESLSVLEQVMRSPIRAGDLDGVIRNIPALVSLNLTEEQARLTAQLASAFVVPNSVYSAQLTDEARQSARDAVAPVERRFVAGEMVVQRGQVITETDIEALEALGLIQNEVRLNDYIGAGAVVTLMAAFVAIFSKRRGVFKFSNLRMILLVALLFLLFLLAARVVIPNRTVIPYLFPIPAFGLLVSLLVGSEISMVLSFILSVLAAYGLPNSLDLTLYYALTSWCGLLVLGPGRRLGVFFRAAGAIALAGSAIVAAYRLPFNDLDLIGLATLVGAAMVNGLASAGITLLLQHILAQQLGLTTALQLLDLARPDTPLLQFFLRNAPGTYQHSLQVSNLAEQAAEAIGADTLLVRVGALYHDVGKANNPAFFIENQIPGSINTHDDITPEEASAIVVRHVTDGVQMAKKYRLPDRIQDFILEHHGTLITRYQYNKAVERAGGDKSKVDIEKFRYPGPAPRSRETALLMFADGVEARARAERPKDEDELRRLVRSVIDTCQREGQLDDTRLTLRDLHLITEAFVTALRGIYHPRIEYPKLQDRAESATHPTEKKKQP